MTTTENKRSDVPKDQPLLKVPLKRLMRDNGTDGTPIKKRVMAALNLSCKKIPETSLKAEANSDLSPGLKHTLAQFSLSSQCSLGGPAAFTGHHGQYKLAPPLAHGGIAGGPLLVPPDSSTDLSMCSLEGESISCFSVGGELRLCLPQLLNTILRDFSLQQINSVCDQLYLYCSRCDATQLHILKVLGILPPGTPSCGLITLTDAQRLCNTLLHPGEEPLDREQEEKDGEESGGFWVEHQCLGKCQGLFVPQLYSSPDAPCIRCSQCRMLFCTERFVMHSHRQPDKRTCHWGFDSAKWACYLQLAQRHLGMADEEKLQQSLEDMKAKFQQEKRQPLVGVSSPAFVFDSRLLASLKEEPSNDDLMWQSWYQYAHDKPAGNGLAQHSGCLPAKEMGSPGTEMQTDTQDEKNQDAHDTDTKTLTFTGQEKSVQSDDGSADEWQRMADSPDCKRSIEHTKDNMVVELLQMYSAQHNKLQSTLCRQKQLEKELQALRQGETLDRCDLHGELEAVQTEHAQRLGEVQQEQRKLKSRLDQLRQQECRCKQQSTETHQETIYARQLSELRQRLDRAEEDREELQEELRREREARERLERTISELKQQMRESTHSAQHDSMDSPSSSSYSDTHMSPAS